MHRDLAVTGVQGFTPADTLLCGAGAEVAFSPVAQVNNDHLDQFTLTLFRSSVPGWVAHSAVPTATD